MGGRSGGFADVRRPPVAPVLWLTFAILAVITFGCGLIGLEQYLSQNPDLGYSDHPLDVLYYALQLFVLGSPPLDGGGPFPPILDFARFAAPTVTAYALIEASRLLFASEIRKLQARTARGHVIVVGDNLVATTLARRLRQAGDQVITVPSRATETARVTGAARDPDILRAASVGRARAVYACTDDSAANTAIALAAARPRRNGATLAVYAQVADPEVCAALQARLLSAPPRQGTRLDFFNIDDLAARHLIAREPLALPGARPPTIAILGATAFGRAVLVELARQWRIRDPAAEPLPIEIVDPGATEAVNHLTDRYPFLTRICKITPHDAGLDRLLATPSDGPVPDRVFICYDDEQQALKAALTAEQVWPGEPGSVVVRLDRLASLREAFDGGDRVLDELSGTLRLFGVVHAACDPVLIGDDLVERLARVIHERYVLDLTGRGESGPALVPWDDLPDRLRLTNRAQAEDVGRKLRAIGCTLSPRVGPGRAHALTEDEVERLAVMEHERWRRDRTAQGWRFAADRDDEHKLHPAMAAWPALRDEMRTRNLDEIRQLPAILADAGFRIVRLRA
ncbi:RyR domain-containing protein [Asanoa iriomotensis]|uniref:TrkA family protein n=1 Tax=Asanoa iriomotensis TaxID=234613 RepID=A0ABQ4CE52_9ACTN|nr:RyR domain-containing protein [Asanoa iriomotensis]GIF61057.1 hypothetical protein Air01nite_71520 [Asanoa iriomotensis]